MVLTKDELTNSLKHEIDILLHLAGKIEPEMLGYRPAPKQRSLLELLQYLTILGPIHMRGVLADKFSMDTWQKAWSDGEATAQTLNLDQIKTALAALTTLFADLLNATSDEDLRAPFDLFGRKATRGSWLVSLVLNHYVAYRMQVFLYLKAAGREELSTMNLWAGMDA